MKILQIQMSSASSLGGGNSYRYNLMKFLNNLHFTTVDFDEKNKKSLYQSLPNVNICTIFRSPLTEITFLNFLKHLLLDIFSIICLKHKIYSLDYEVINFHGVSFFKSFQIIDKRFKGRFTRLMLFFLFKKRTNVIMTLHNIHKISNSTNKFIYDEYISFFQNFVCVDNHIYNYVKAKNPHKNIFLLPNSVPYNKLKNIKPKGLKKEIVIGFVGRNAETTNDIKMLTDLVNKNINGVKFKLLIAGEKIENISSSEIMYNLPPHEIYKYYNEFDLVFNPILHSAISRVTLEAMSFGVPVMMYNYNNRSQYFNDLNGISIDQNLTMIIDKIKFYRDNRPLLLNISKNSKSVIDEYYSNHVVLKRLLNIYKNL